MKEKNIGNEIINRLKGWAEGGSAPPLRIEIYTTLNCNLSCPICPNSSETTKISNEMNKKGWEQIVSEGMDMGVKEWWITGGGEPFTRKELLLNLVDEIKQRDTVCEITTNGTLFDEKSVEKFIRRGVDKVWFSIDAPDADSHDLLRGRKGTFEKVVKNLELFRERKSKLGRENPKTTISAVVTKKNIDKLEEFILLADELGCEEIRFKPFRIFEETEEFARGVKIRDESKLEKSIDGAKKFSQGLDVEVDFEKFNLSKTGGEGEKTANKDSENQFLQSFCFEPWYALLIDPYGNIAPCCSWDKGAKEGPNLQNKSLKEVWNSDYLNSIRKDIKSGQRMEECSECGFKETTNTLRKELKNKLKHR